MSRPKRRSDFSTSVPLAKNSALSEAERKKLIEEMNQLPLDKWRSHSSFKN